MIFVLRHDQGGEMKRPFLALGAALLVAASIAGAANAARPHHDKGTFSDVVR
jgi:hypothetical protein